MPKSFDESTIDPPRLRHKSGGLRIALPTLLLAALCLAGCPRTPLPGGPRGAADRRTHIINFNVGQSDAMLVVHRGRAMLYDAGASMGRTGRQNFRNIGRRLEELVGHRNLDYFVVSHFHQDHIGLHGTGARAGLGDLGLWGLLNDEGITVDTLVDRGFFVLGDKVNTQKHYEKAARGWLRDGKVRRRLRVKRHDLIDMGPGLRVEVIAANGNGRLLSIHRRMPGFFKTFPPSENDYSVVLKFSKGPFEMVVGGDLSGADVTRRFGRAGMSYNDVETYIAADIGDVEVYRVNHHGSKNSSNPCFISVLHPEVSIFSTGMNSYGHPDPRVYKALKKTGKVYITGGADVDVYDLVKEDIKEADIVIQVSASGETYTVNGDRFKSLTEEQERARPGYTRDCPASVPTEKSYREEEGEIHGD